MSKDFENLESKAKEIFDELYDKLELRVKKLSKQVQNTFFPDAEEKLKKNIFKTVFFSFGFGFLFGLILTLIGLHNGKKKKK